MSDELQSERRRDVEAADERTSRTIRTSKRDRSDEARRRAGTGRGERRRADDRLDGDRSVERNGGATSAQRPQIGDRIRRP